jgi:DNA-directed RNA polymerase subunit RPC12/RpoP
MAEIKTFICPNCGSSQTPTGMDKMIRCAYCGSSIFVPQELLGQGVNTGEELTPEQALFSPEHVDWLVQHGVEITVVVDFLKERDEPLNGNPVFDLHLSGKKANGKKFDNMATINVPRNLVPRQGAAIKIRYNANKSDELDVEDFVLQIGGQFVYCFTDDDSFLDL